ncbi:pentapeptide repeat-containing protein [uncultured Sphingomonas sp.]|uniref:pentapeptide repeat-containing protein n=1 Tax=uncultured Sphingomonas sp. TaxID=158754 RepID=UPI0025F62B87|nr:pentapeptide repeat-containing protein [uncultured Sphingomonas sp.]
MLRRLLGMRSPPSAFDKPNLPVTDPAQMPEQVTRSDAPTLGEPIARVRLSQATHSRLVLKNRRFDDLNANQAIFVDCDFSYSVFERAYFRGVKFENCRFVGCRFTDSNLRGVSFHICDFKYATFQRTLIETKEMLAVLPLEPNLRRDSLQNLRANAAEIGDYASQRLFVLAEVEAHRDHLTRALRGSEDYYRRKYPGVLDKLGAFTALTRLRIGGAIWGHGERPFRMLVSATVLLVALTLVNFLAVLPRVIWADTHSGTEVLRYSIDMLLDANPQAKFRGFLLVDYALIAMRYVYIGLFISVLSKSMSHR